MLDRISSSLHLTIERFLQPKELAVWWILHNTKRKHWVKEHNRRYSTAYLPYNKGTILWDTFRHTLYHHRNNDQIVCSLLLILHYSKIRYNRHVSVFRLILHDFNAVLYLHLFQPNLGSIFSQCWNHLYTHNLYLSLLYLFNHGIRMPGFRSQFNYKVWDWVTGPTISNLWLVWLFHHVVITEASRNKHLLNSHYMDYSSMHTMFMALIVYQPHMAIVYARHPTLRVHSSYPITVKAQLDKTNRQVYHRLSKLI